jgi:hypothetical protein
MAATTTAFTACDWVLELADETDTLQDVSGSSTTCDVNLDNQIGEFRPFGTQWKTRTQCGKDASFKIKGIATTAANEIRDLIKNWYFNGSGPRRFRLSEPGGNPGDERYLATCFLKSYKFSGDANSADPVMYDIELVPTGEVELEVIP